MPDKLEMSGLPDIPVPRGLRLPDLLSLKSANRLIWMF